MGKRSHRIWELELSYADILCVTSRSKAKDSCRELSMDPVWITSVSCDIDWDTIEEWIYSNKICANHASLDIQLAVKYHGFNLCFLCRSRPHSFFRQTTIAAAQNENLQVEINILTGDKLALLPRSMMQNYPKGKFHIFIRGCNDRLDLLKLVVKRGKKCLLQELTSHTQEESADSCNAVGPSDFEEMDYYGIKCFKKVSQSLVCNDSGEPLGVFNSKHGTIDVPCDQL